MLLLFLVVSEVNGTAWTCARLGRITVIVEIGQHLLAHEHSVPVSLVAEAVRSIELEA